MASGDWKFCSERHDKHVPYLSRDYVYFTGVVGDLGEYIIKQNVKMTKTEHAIATGQAIELGVSLLPGSVATILEVRKEGDLIRGRVNEPAGWITLKNAQTTYATPLCPCVYDGKLSYFEIVDAARFNHKMDRYDAHIQQTLKDAMAKVTQDIKDGIQADTMRAIDAAIPSIKETVLGEVRGTLQQVKLAISEKFDDEAEHVRVSDASDASEVLHLPLRQSLEHARKQQSDAVQSLAGKVDMACSVLVEDMCCSAVETNNMIDLQRAVQFARDAQKTDGPQYIAAVAYLDETAVNGLTSHTLATSKFKSVYEPSVSELRRQLNKPGALPSSGAGLLDKVKTFLRVRSRTGGKGWSDAQIDTCVDELTFSCNKAIKVLPELASVRDWASFIWTTTDAVLQIGGTPREFCFIMSEAFRDDDEEALKALLPFVLVLNSTLVTRGAPERHELWPKDDQKAPVRESYRGTGIPTSKLAWFKKVGRVFRVPFNLASALNMDIAKSFAERSVSNDASKTPIVFHIKFPQSVETPAACMHVTLLRRSIIPTELEFLFAAYSVFTIIDFEERRGGLLPGDWLHVTLEAAEDNKVNEHMPLAQWM